MKAQEWVQSALVSKLNENGLQLDEKQAVAVADFCTFFGASIEGALEDGRDIHMALTTERHTFEYGGASYSLTATEMGYTPYFDQWHLEGLI